MDSRISYPTGDKFTSEPSCLPGGRVYNNNNHNNNHNNSNNNNTNTNSNNDNLGWARACVNTWRIYILLHVGCITLANMLYID